MKILIRVIRGHSGADVHATQLAELLDKEPGTQCTLQFLPHWLQFVPRLLTLLPQPKADVIISNAEYCWAMRRKHTTLIGILHQNVLDPSYQKHTTLLQKIYHRCILCLNLRKSLQQADSIVAVAKHLKQFIQHVNPKTNCTVIPNAVDTDFFSPRESSSEKDICRILFVGNASRRKGAELLSKIAEELGNGYNVRFTTGRSSGVQNVSSTMTCLGSLGKASLQREYRDCDIFLLPSYHEGMSLALLEAISSGCIPVVSNCNGNTELVDDETGIICEMGNTKKFSSAILKLWSSPELRKSMSEKSRNRVLQDHNLATYTKAYIRAIELAQTPTPPEGIDPVTPSTKSLQ